ncbi:hypothetical protein SNE40_018203 [Patella caerulea]|uniref:DUF7869 domain-containing protein n=1 Tax=Patella caerulea TaxID=87958 RepID=A0AAN8J988_PATCE
MNQELNNDENPTQKRKGIVDRDNWKTIKNKRLRMEGKNYSGYKKNDETVKYEYTEREERKLGKRCDHNPDHCKMKKCNTVSDEDRQNLFDEFWKRMDWGQQKVYIASLITYYHVPHRGCRPGTFKYNLRVNDARINVCKNMFLNTFGLKEWSVRNWVLCAKDKNGMHESYSYRKQKGDTPTANKTKISIAREFLKSLPKLPSHYLRSDSSKHYLETTIDTKRKLYEVFQNYCDSKGYPKVSIQVLSKVMNEENIAITKPKKDECNVCCSYKLNTISDEEHDLHIQRKEEAKEEKKKDKEEAQAADGDIVVLTMDLQVVLLSPRIFANANYYKTKLSCHNFTTYNLGTREVYCYFWHEGQGEVTGNNFASCIVDQVQNIISQNVEKPPKTIILYSDGCCYQNRNFVLANALLDLSVSTGVTIIQKFLEKGHTWMEVDSVHSAIENKLRNREVYWPAEYVNIFRSARRESQYKIKYVDHTFFKNYSQLSYLSSIRPGNSVGDHVVTDIRALKYSPDLKVEFKLLFSEEWQLLPRRPKARHNQFVTPLYRHPLPIKKSKWQHLQELKKVLPREYHHFYDSLPYVHQE